MTPFFTRERFGRPQLYAALLLLAFAVQCLWVMWRVPPQSEEIEYISQGRAQWQEGVVDGSSRSPLIGLIASAGLAAFPGIDANFAGLLPRLLARLPFLAMALLFGASVWYVTHRLYGNAGGYVALVLYCFSPAVVRAGALVNVDGPAAWGFFGGIFSGIALSHTVYALGESPTQQVAGYRIWRWRRIALLGVAFGIAVGAHLGSAIVVPLALAFMLYLAPGRRTACVAIVAVACVIAMAVLLTAYFFRLDVLIHAMGGQAWLSMHQVIPPLLPGPGPVKALLLLAAFITYTVWPRAGYFGNTAPFLVLLTLWVVSADWLPRGFQLQISVFAAVFIAGLAADLLETKYRRVVLALLVLLLGVQVGWALREVSQWDGAEIVHPQTAIRYHLLR